MNEKVTQEPTLTQKVNKGLIQDSFLTEAFGKWILVGEHSVLRGAPALVFPMKQRSLKLNYVNRDSVKTDESPLVLEVKGPHGQELEILFWGVFQKACELKRIDRSQIGGQIILDNSIPIGAGMGASASLCVAVVRFFEYLGLAAKDEIYDFARTLENLFHGESSGVDIAVCLAQSPLYFERNGLRKVLDIKWRPHLYVSYSGQRGVTRDCISLVAALHERNPEFGRQLDQKMSQAAHLAIEALGSDQSLGFIGLQKAINQAQECFLNWGLCEQGVVLAHVEKLKSRGASAVKMTGSGAGGFVLSLWQDLPPEDLRSELIPCF